MDNLARRNSVHSKEKDYTDGDATQVHTNTSAYSHEGETPKRKTSFSTLPNTTTWQQQSVINQHDPNGKRVHLACKSMKLNEFFFYQIYTEQMTIDL